MMKRLLILLLLAPSVALCAVDTFEGTAFTTSNTVEGTSGVDTVEGAGIVAGGGEVTPFFEADWNTNTPGADDETCEAAGGCPDTWDTITNDDKWSISSGNLLLTIDDTTSNIFLGIDDSAGNILNGQSITEYWGEIQLEFSSVNTWNASTSAYTSRFGDLVSGDNNAWSILFDTGGGSTVYRLKARYQADSGGVTGGYQEWTPAASTLQYIRFHYKRDTDGGADIGGDDGTLEIWADTTETSCGLADACCQYTGLDTDGRGVLSNLNIGFATSIYQSSSLTITYHKFKLYTSNPGW